VLSADRLGALLRAARSERERLLVVYLTLGDPLTSGPPGLATVIAHAGVDVLELGIPTPGARPRGAAIGASFERSRGVGLARVWAELGELRRRLPSTPLILLVYPETVADIGWSRLLAESTRLGVDGMVLTEPTVAALGEVSAAGLNAIPLIRPTTDRDTARQLEDCATDLTYRALAAGTGATLDGGAVAQLTTELAVSSLKPFIVGFGMRNEREIRTVAPHVAGVVIGSEFLIRISEVAANDRPRYAEDLIQRWKTATVVGAVAGAEGDGRG
jgi:tryptophan synthase alpha chain